MSDSDDDVPLGQLAGKPAAKKATSAAKAAPKRKAAPASDDSDGEPEHEMSLAPIVIRARVPVGCGIVLPSSRCRLLPTLLRRRTDRKEKAGGEAEIPGCAPRALAQRDRRIAQPCGGSRTGSFELPARDGWMWMWMGWMGVRRAAGRSVPEMSLIIGVPSRCAAAAKGSKAKKAKTTAAKGKAKAKKTTPAAKRGTPKPYPPHPPPPTHMLPSRALSTWRDLTWRPGALAQIGALNVVPDRPLGVCVRQKRKKQTHKK